MIFAVVFGLVMTQILYRKKINDIGAGKLTKITANVQKRWSRPRWATIFCRMQIYAMTRKKALNSAAQRGRLHGEIKVWKLELVFCKYLCTSYLGEIFERVQFVPFSLLSWLRSVHFVPYKYKMRGKSIWNIWTRIKWEAKLANLKWRPSMGLNP